jgi:trans-aconitate methyltransferase
MRAIFDLIKNIDQKTGYKIGNIIRKLTNTNTKKYWNQKMTVNSSSEDFRYKYFLEFLPKNSYFYLLDIGCAFGDGCILLKNNFPQADINGADFSEVRIKKAKQKSNKINFFVLDIAKEEPSLKYDYITLIHTLEHFNDPFPIVDKCLRFVNKALIIEVPYIKNFKSPYLYRKGLHRYLFNENTFSKYKCIVLNITEYIKSAGYKYIIYKLTPQE